MASNENPTPAIGSLSLEDLNRRMIGESVSSTTDGTTGLELELSDTISIQEEEQEDKDLSSNPKKVSGDNDPPGGEEEETSEIEKREEFKTSGDYTEVLKKVLGEDFNNVLIDVDGEQVPLDQIEIDFETFQDVLADHVKEVEEKAGKGKVSLERLSDFTRSLIEIEENGGNISEALAIKRDFSDPLDQIDLTTTEGQKEAIRLRLKAGGHTDDHINRLIKSYEADGVLEEYGNAAHDELKTAIDAKIQAKVEESQKLVQRKKELMKEFKKELKENLSVFQLKDPLKNKIVELATKEEKEGRFAMDEMYYEWRSNPKKAARLALFLLDEEEFIKQVSNKAVVDSKLESARKRVIIRKDAAGAITDRRKTDATDSIPLEELKTR